jgi:hypothetical protein
MASHVVHSVKHGELRIVTTEGNYGQGRTWRAVLDPTPIRLAHLTAFDGAGELEVLAGILHSAEQYDAVGVQPRRRKGDPED